MSAVDAHGCNDAGIARARAGDIDAALALFDRALALDPDHAPALGNRGMALLTLGRADAAVISFERAIACDPYQAEVHVGRGHAMSQLGNPAAALASYELAVVLGFDPAAIEPGRRAAAAAARGGPASPAYIDSPGFHLAIKTGMADWTGLDTKLAALRHAIATPGVAVMPFTALSLVDDPALHRACAAVFIAAHAPRVAAPLSPHPPHDRIRIGYVSADFYSHATMLLIADMLDAHDRDRFEIVALSYGPDRNDRWTARAKAACDHFIDVSEQSDEAIAARARAMEIDIAVDLKGLTIDCRPGILAARAAPVQVNFLGYPGTMAAPFIDYLIADATIVPSGSEHHYQEKIVRLPDTYQPNCRTLPLADDPPDRRAAGLPEDAIVFCCFNQIYKIMPDMFGVWMTILRDVEGSVLWLHAEHPIAQANLRRTAAAHGVAADRIVFAQGLPNARHLARLRLADVFLDTRPYNAHTTASDALRMGVPIVTCPGTSFASRVAASVLAAVGLADLAVPTLGDYHRLAVDLARNPDRLAAIRQQLAAALPQESLFDPVRFTRHIEAAYQAIDARCRAGLAPDHLTV